MSDPRVKTDPAGARLPGFPVPGRRPTAVLVPAPGPGAGNWVGAPSAVSLSDDEFVLAYRHRTASGRGGSVEVVRWRLGGEIEPLVSLPKQAFGAESLERPALLRRPGGGWRIYLSCATPGSKHWRIDAIDAADPAGFDPAAAVTALPGDRAVAVKDPVIAVDADGAWTGYVCCHPLDVAGAEDRMATAQATSDDGLDWVWRGTVLRGRDGHWDGRGTRVTAVLPGVGAAYDGRASAAENFSERTGLATWDEAGLTAVGTAPVSDVRYLDVVALPGGGYRLFYEQPLADGSHQLVTEPAD